MIVIVGWFFFYSDVGMVLFCLVVVGVGIGFFVFNWLFVCVFLGDVGSLMLGVVFVLLVLYGVVKY